MSHITYNEFKNRFGDLGITKYTKAMWLEAGCEEIGVLYCKDMELKEHVSNCAIYGIMVDDYQTPSGIRIANDLYSYNFTLISDGRTWQQTPAYSVYGTNFSGSLGSYGNINVTLPLTWTEAQCEAYLKDKVILYKKKPATTVINPAIKIEGELGRFLNAQGEWTTGSTSLGAFKYEVTGGHTYDVVNAKAASSSYIMFLDANGNRIGNVVALTSSNYPKVGDTRPMAMPANCKYVWLVMSSSNVNLPILLIS